METGETFSLSAFCGRDGKEELSDVIERKKASRKEKKKEKKKTGEKDEDDQEAQRGKINSFEHFPRYTYSRGPSFPAFHLFVYLADTPLMRRSSPLCVQLDVVSASDV